MSTRWEHELQEREEFRQFLEKVHPDAAITVSTAWTIDEDDYETCEFTVLDGKQELLHAYHHDGFGEDCPEDLLLRRRMEWMKHIGVLMQWLRSHPGPVRFVDARLMDEDENWAL